MKTKTKLIIAVATFIAVIGTLIFTSIGTTGTFYMTVDELLVNKAKAEGKPINVSGKIVGDSIVWDPDQMLLSFDIKGENNETISVEYGGVKPDSMNDGWEAIVEGELTPNGTLVATELLVKCPSKYEAMEENGEKLPEDHEPIVEQQEGGEK
jgi:cytochrome c-type biogenesis protein CcmE